MRLVIVNPVWDPAHDTPDSTLARFTTLTGWASAVHNAGAHVVVCQRFHSNAGLKRDGVRYWFAGDRQRPTPRWSARGTQALLSAIDDAEPDVVHFNGLLFPELIRSIRKALPKRSALVVQDHGGFDPSSASVLTRAWLRRGLAAADAAMAASSGQAELFHTCGVAPARLAVVDVMEGSTLLRSVPRGDARTALSMHEQPSLLWVGRLNHNKDPMCVLHGFALFADICLSATLTMVFHGGELTNAVRDFAASHPVLSSRVRLIGAVAHDQLAHYYSAADMLVLGSRHEGSGYAALEALACGCPPVVTDIAPFRAITGDGAAGELWAPGRADACAAAMVRAWARGEALRASAAARFEREFSWSAIGARALRVYRSAMELRGRARAAAPQRSTV